MLSVGLFYCEELRALIWRVKFSQHRCRLTLQRWRGDSGSDDCLSFNGLSKSEDPPCLCGRRIFLFYGLINFSGTISLHAHLCFDKCSEWTVHTMCFLLLHWKHHMINRSAHQITQMCLWGCPSLHYREELSVTAASVWHMWPSTRFSLSASEGNRINMTRGEEKWSHRKRYLISAARYVP